MIIMLKIPVSETEKWKRKAKETKQVWHDAKWRKVVQMNTMGLSTCILYVCTEGASERPPKAAKKRTLCATFYRARVVLTLYTSI